MHLVPLSPRQARDRLARALPGLPARDDTARMPPAPPLEAPTATLGVWLGVELGSAADRDPAAWDLPLGRLKLLAPVDAIDDDRANVRRVEIPFLSIGRGFRLGRPTLGRITELAVEHGLTVATDLTPDQAIERTDAIVQLATGRNAWIEYVVRPRPRWFRTGRLAMRSVFDVMLSMGWAWGDGDLFRWPGSGVEGAVEVSTTTAPGFFLPEEAASGAAVDDLLFRMYLPFSTAPRVAHDGMLRAVEHVAAALGGVPSGTGPDSYDPEGDRRGVDALVRALEERGLPPGSAAARAVF